MRSKLFAQLVVPAIVMCAVVLGAGSTMAAATNCDTPTPLQLPALQTTVGNGTAASCTQTALRAAVAAGGHITFRCGGTNTTIVVTPELQVAHTTVIDGGGTITLDGGGKNRILVAGNGVTLSVRNLRFINGTAAPSPSRAIGSGGAVAGEYRTHVEVIASTFMNNTAGLGGGAVAVGTDSTLTITGSTFTGNTSWYGGAVYSLLSPLTVTDSTFTGNRTTTTGGLGDGGAIGTDGASPPDTGGGVIRICGTHIDHNTGHGNGGGAYLWAYAQDKIIIERSVFDANTVTSNGRNNGGLGGAARVSIGPTDHHTVGSITIDSSTMMSNTSGNEGGAFYLDCAPTCTVTNSTFDANSATAYGGALFGDGHHDNNVTFANNTAGGQGGALFGKNYVLNNTVFTGNSAHNPWGLAMTCNSKGTGAHVIQWLATSRDTSQPCISGATAANPHLAAPAANGGPTPTMMPAANSPVVHAGSRCEAQDQRGASRNASVCDLGAVQRSVYVPATRSPGPAAAVPSATSSSIAPTSHAPSVVHAADATGSVPLERHRHVHRHRHHRLGGDGRMVDDQALAPRYDSGGPPTQTAERLDEPVDHLVWRACRSRPPPLSPCGRRSYDRRWVIPPRLSRLAATNDTYIGRTPGMTPARRRRLPVFNCFVSAYGTGCRGAIRVTDI